MKRLFIKALPELFLLALLLAGCARSAAGPATAASAKPWPTHAPGATPYVHTMSETAPSPETQEGEVFETMEDLWDSIYERFGNFYAKKDELKMFRELPQNEPYSFVPHSPRDVLDEGEAMRTAKLFDALDGVNARVIAMHQIVDGLDDWGFMTVLTMTPARLFELSEQVDEMYMFEQFYPSVEKRFDIAYWPDGLYESANDMLDERYERLGCFFFEPTFREEFQAMPEEEEADFAIVEFTPSGWSQSGQSVIWQVQGREGITVALRWHEDGPETLAVLTASPERITALSEELHGRYLISPMTEELLARFDQVVNMEEEVAAG